MDTEFLHFADRKGDYRIPLNDITHIDADGPYSTIYTSVGEIYVCCKNLKKLSCQLAGYFTFPHRSYIINKNHVKEFKKADAVIVLTDGAAIPLARNRRTNFLKWLRKRDKGTEPN